MRKTARVVKRETSALADDEDLEKATTQRPDRQREENKRTPDYEDKGIASLGHCLVRLT